MRSVDGDDMRGKPRRVVVPASCEARLAQDQYPAGNMAAGRYIC